MKLCNQMLLMGLIAMGLGACSDENPWIGSEGQGGISLQLSSSADVKDALPLVRAVPGLEAPDAELFAIKLLNNDTGSEQIWNTLEEFRAEEGFDVGDYTLTAYYGSIHDSGFDKPCFIGTAEVSVHEGRQSDVDVTATLAHTMISVEYTDAFKQYFRDYRSVATTDGDNDVKFAKDETRPGFLAPGNVSLMLTVTHPSGKTLTLSAARFTALARHHYHMTYNVTADPTGDAALEVIFDDTLEKEKVVISMSDELVNSPVPVVTAVGFTPGTPVDAVAGNPAPVDLKFHAMVKAGISSCELTVAGGNYQPVFGRMVELVGADDNLQAQLKESGVIVTGLYKDPDANNQWVGVDVTQLSANLPEGNFTVTLKVTDVLGRMAEPVTLDLQTSKVEIGVVEENCKANYIFRDASGSGNNGVPATVEITYNGFRPEMIHFENFCQNDGYKASKVVSWAESPRTRNLETKNYIFNLELCDVEHNPLPMKLIYKNMEIPFNITVIEPEYRLEADAMSTLAMLKVVPQTESQLVNIVNGLYLYAISADGKVVSAYANGNITRDTAKGIVTLTDLTPDTDYVLGYSLTDVSVGTKLPEDQIVTLHTEAQLQIPNSDFSQTSQLKIDNLQCGGTYYGAPITYTNKSSIDRLVPNSWATINPKTCNPNALNMNTWFVVPSTYVENGQAIIRNVGYSTNGQTPARTGGVAGSTNYNTSAATFADNEKVAGELFLGSYSFDNTAGASRSSGINFSSRPKSLTFDYSYVPQGTDTGSVYVALLDASGAKIFEKSTDLTTSSAMKKVTVNFATYSFGKKVAKLRVEFKSSKSTIAPIHIPSGSELNEGFRAVGNHTIDANKYHAVATGSVLTVDNIKLNY